MSSFTNTRRPWGFSWNFTTYWFPSEHSMRCACAPPRILRIQRLARTVAGHSVLWDCIFISDVFLSIVPDLASVLAVSA